MKETLRRILSFAHAWALNGLLSRAYSAAIIDPPKIKTVKIGDVPCRFHVGSNYVNAYLGSFPDVSPNERATFDALTAILRAGDVVYDVGANIGVYVIWLANDGRSKSVVAFEPEGVNFGALKRNAVLNRANRIVALPIAASDRSGFRQFFQASAEEGDASAFMDDYRVADTRGGPPCSTSGQSRLTA